MTKIQNLKQLLKQYNIRPSKRLGQSFLIDNNVLEKIINAANLSKNDIVLEIGPGLGGLTKELAKRVKRVIAIEKDKKFCEILKQELKDYKNVEIINADILKNVGYLASDIKYKVVANLPYYITSPVIRRFLEAGNRPEQMILMVQKEVAERIIAKNNKMSLLSVSVQFYAKPEIISYVSKDSFYPKPKVDSAIIRITPQQTPEINIKKFFELVKISFSSKRKKLKNNIAPWLKMEKSDFEEILKELKINPNIRAENLSIKNWLKLYESINSINS